MKNKLLKIFIVCFIVGTVFIPSVKAQDEDNESPALKAAMELSFKGKKEQAIQDIKNIIQQDGQNIQAHTCLGLIYFKNRQYDNALEEFTTVVTIKKESPMAYYFMGLIYEEKAEHISNGAARILKTKALEAWQNYLDSTEKTPLKSVKEHQNIGITRKESTERAKKHIAVLKGEIGYENN